MTSPPLRVDRARKSSTGVASVISRQGPSMFKNCVPDECGPTNPPGLLPVTLGGPPRTWTNTEQIAGRASKLGTAAL